MPDDRKNPGPEDGRYISLNQDYEVIYWSRKLGTTPSGIRAAIAVVGPKVKDVQEYLRSIGPER